MSATPTDGGPAFPKLIREYDKFMNEKGYGRNMRVTVSEGGMSLLDWFAGQATDLDVHKYQSEHPGTTREAAKYHYARAMLAERSKPREAQ